MNPLPLAVLVLLTGCSTPAAVNRGYDQSRLKRIGVLTFDYSGHEAIGAEDVFAKYLLKSGYRVVERSRLEAVMKEHKLSQSGLFAPDTVKKLGQVMGVDALLLGTMTTYQAERKNVVMVELKTTKRDPVFENRERKNSKGEKYLDRIQVGSTLTSEKKVVPQLFPIDAEVGLSAKLVDVETGEIIWIGSYTSQGVNGPIAAESVASYLVKQLAKQVPVAK